MARQQLVLWLVLSSHVSASAAYQGYGTVYSLSSPFSGNCNFMRSPAEAVTKYAALNAEQWEETMNCGRCVEVSCTDPTCSNRPSEIVYILDQCPGCGYGGLDLSPEVFERITGQTYTILPIEWKFVDCPVSNNVEYCLKTGSSEFWVAVQPTNLVSGVTSMKINNRETSRVDSAFYFMIDGHGKSVANLDSLKISVTGVNGEVLEETLSMKANKCTTGSSQFSSGGDVYQTTTVSAPMPQASTRLTAPTAIGQTGAETPPTNSPTMAPATAAPPTIAPQTEAPTIKRTSRPPTDAPSLRPVQDASTEAPRIKTPTPGETPTDVLTLDPVQDVPNMPEAPVAALPTDPLTDASTPDPIQVVPNTASVPQAPVATPPTKPIEVQMATPPTDPLVNASTPESIQVVPDRSSRTKAAPPTEPIQTQLATPPTDPLTNVSTPDPVQVVPNTDSVPQTPVATPPTKPIEVQMATPPSGPPIDAPTLDQDNEAPILNPVIEAPADTLTSAIRRYFTAPFGTKAPLLAPPSTAHAINRVITNLVTDIPNSQQANAPISQPANAHISQPANAPISQPANANALPVLIPNVFADQTLTAHFEPLQIRADAADHQNLQPPSTSPTTGKSTLDPNDQNEERGILANKPSTILTLSEDASSPLSAAPAHTVVPIAPTNEASVQDQMTGGDGLGSTTTVIIVVVAACLVVGAVVAVAIAVHKKRKLLEQSKNDDDRELNDSVEAYHAHVSTPKSEAFAMQSVV